MKIFSYLFSVFALAQLLLGCSQSPDKTLDASMNRKDSLQYKMEIGAMLDSFNNAAASADYERYFNYFTPKAVFIGTDATEYWEKPAFMAWAKPFFDKKKTWHFAAMDRHVYLSSSPDLAWFDELLNTQMKICRGSGVVVKTSSGWKLEQYVLSTTVPNELVDTVTRMKAPKEDSIIDKLLGHR